MNKLLLAMFVAGSLAGCTGDNGFVATGTGTPVPVVGEQGPAGQNGTDGTDGTPGVNGGSCHVEKITCPSTSASSPANVECYCCYRLYCDDGSEVVFHSEC
jgi:hypothetical protein